MTFLLTGGESDIRNIRIVILRRARNEGEGGGDRLRSLIER